MWTATIWMITLYACSDLTLGPHKLGRTTPRIGIANGVEPLTTGTHILSISVGDPFTVNLQSEGHTMWVGLGTTRTSGEAVPKEAMP